MLHGLPDPLGQGQGGLGLVLHHVVPAGHDDKHVVNTNTWTINNSCTYSTNTSDIYQTRTNCNKRENIMSLVVL